MIAFRFEPEDGVERNGCFRDQVLGGGVGMSIKRGGSDRCRSDSQSFLIVGLGA